MLKFQGQREREDIQTLPLGFRQDSFLVQPDDGFILTIKTSSQLTLLNIGNDEALKKTLKKTVQAPNLITRNHS